MTPDPDAPATLRDVAEMMRDALTKLGRMPLQQHAPTWTIFDDLRSIMNELAAAPAVAKAGDGGVLRFSPADNCPSKHQCERLQYCSAYKECRAIGIAQAATSNPGTSPSDPFAPMVEAFRCAWNEPQDITVSRDAILRRALAAAIENAPFSDATRDAFFSGNHSTGATDVWRKMTRALAADLRGGK